MLSIQAYKCKPAYVSRPPTRRDQPLRACVPARGRGTRRRALASCEPGTARGPERTTRLPPIDDHPAASRGIRPRVWFGRHGRECSGGNGRRFESVAGSVDTLMAPILSPWDLDGRTTGWVWSGRRTYGVASRVDRNVFRQNRMCTRNRLTCVSRSFSPCD